MARLGVPNRANMVLLLCPALSLSVLVILLCTITIDHNIVIATYNHCYQSLLGAGGRRLYSKFGCNTTSTGPTITSTADDHPRQYVYTNKYHKEVSKTQLYLINKSDEVEASTQVHSSTNTRHNSFSYESAGVYRPLLDTTSQTLSKTKAGGLSTTGSKGYVLVVNFEEQLCSALYDIYQLANVATSWNMTVVEPYIQGSQFKFKALPPKTTSPQMLRYRDILDLNETNNLFKSCLKSNRSILTPFEDFAEDASHIEHVLVLYLNRYRESQTTCERVQYANALELTRRVDGYIRRVSESRRNRSGWKLANFGTIPHSVTCLDTRKTINFHHLLKTDPQIKLITQSHSNILVLIPTWRGIRKVQHKFFYYDHFYRQPPCRELHSIPHSKRIQSASEKYRKYLQLDHPFIGIHIRLERVIRTERRLTGYLSRCITEFFQLLQTLLRSHNSTSHQEKKSIVFRDYSESGSMTCANVGCRRIANELRLDEKLNKIGVKMGQYSPVTFGEPSVSGYISMTELELLSNADYLLTLGHGSYHSRLIHRFNINHGTSGRTKHDSGEENLFTVCHNV